MIILTWWEVEELTDHFLGRPDIWTWDEASKCWLRTDSEGTPLLGLRILGPNAPGPYRKFKLAWIPVTWLDELCTQYITQLVTRWTSYGFRIAVQELLTTDDGIKMDPRLAEAVAVAISKIEQEPAPDPEKLSIPTQGELWPDLSGVRLEPYTMERTIRTVGLVGGGWLSIRYQGEMLRIRLSIPSIDYGGGYDHPFEGYIRPRHGNIPLTIASLMGVETHVRQTNSVPEAATERGDQRELYGSSELPEEGSADLRGGELPAQDGSGEDQG